MDRIIFEHLFGILGVDERVIQCDELDVRVVNGITQDDAANSTKPIDVDLGCYIRSRDERDVLPVSKV
jgi:hypothetical protein